MYTYTSIGYLFCYFLVNQLPKVLDLKSYLSLDCVNNYTASHKRE